MGTLLTVPLGSTTALASTCAQSTHVWVGGRDNNGAISSVSPGGTIFASQMGNGVYLTGVVQPGTAITVTFTHTNGVANQNFTTVNAASNCVVPHDVLQDIVWLDYDPFTGTILGSVPDTQQVYASYVQWENGQRTAVFLGTIQVGP